MSDEYTAGPHSPPSLPNAPTAQPASAPRRRAPQGDHRDFRDPRNDRDPRHRTHRVNSSATRCVALVDARFWSWLHDAAQEETPGVPAGLQDQLEQLLAQSGPGAQLLRTIWYTDESAMARHQPGVTVRHVPSNAQDGGVAMLRGMAQDMIEIAQRAGADRVLLVSDDERLLLAVDEAQRCGLMVDMVVDDEAGDLAALREDDPQWARLLLTADRHLVLGATAPSRAASQRERDPAREARSAPTGQAAQIIEEEIQAWWSEETPSQREHWRTELQTTRGIPQELDRQLLLRISRRLGQALTPPEKNAMRALARRQIQSEADEGSAGPGLALMPQPADG